MKTNGTFANLGGMAACAVACAAFFAPCVAHAETWYWVGGNLDASSHSTWGGGYNNWTNALGEAGEPDRGDNAMLTDNSRPTVYNVCNSIGDDNTAYGAKLRRPLNSIVFDGYKKSCNQGNFALIGGGEGLTVLGANYAQSHYTGILLEGEGEVPFNIVEASSEFRSQMRVVVRNVSNDTAGVKNPTLVKKGLGTLVSYYQGGNRAYEIPLNKIQQGRLDVTTSKTLTNVKFQFDGDDPSARLSWGQGAAKIQFSLGSGCAILENGVNNTEHGIACAYDQQLQFTGTPGDNPMRFSGQFYGGAGLRWNPSSADYSFVYSTAVCATTGSVAAVSGTVRLVNGATFTALSSLSVGATGVLEIDSGSGANFHAESFDIVSGGKMNLGSGVVVTVHAATLDTLPIKAGIYAASAGEGVNAADWVEGDGSVVVETGDLDAAKWVGAGADTGIATDGNWSPATPELAAGSTFAVFAEGGTTANLDRDASFAGLSLKGGFSFAGNGTLQVGAMGAATLDSEVGVIYNFDCPVGIAAAQEWTVGANNTFYVNNGLSGEGSLAVSGDGVFNVGGTSTLAGPVDIGTKATISGVNALGAAGTVARVRNDSGDICFSSATNDAAVSFYSVATASDQNVLKFVGDNVFNGPVTNVMGRLDMGDGATVEFAKRFRGDVLRYKGVGNVIFRDKLVLTGSNWTMYMSEAGSDVTVDFYAVNNGMSGIFWSSLFYGSIRCHVPYAIQATYKTYDAGASNGTRVEFKDPFVLDLGGCDQSVDGLCSTKGGTVTSEEPAFFHHAANNPYNVSNDPDNANPNRTNNLVFAGMAGFSYDGPMTNRLGGVSTTAGTLQVTKGRLVMLPQASWLNSTNIVVTGGVLALENAEAFHRKAVVNISGEGKLDLAFDGKMNCENFYLDGVLMTGGIYGSEESSAGHKLSCFDGPGILVVRSKGLRVTVR